MNTTNGRHRNRLTKQKNCFPPKAWITKKKDRKKDLDQIFSNYVVKIYQIKSKLDYKYFLREHNISKKIKNEMHLVSSFNTYATF